MTWKGLWRGCVYIYGQVSDGPAAADGVYPGGLRGGGHPPQDRYTFLLVPYNNDKDRRKAKGRRYCLGAELVQFLAALAICTRMIWRKGLINPYSDCPGALHPILHIVLVQFILFFKSSWCKIAIRGKEMNRFCPHKEQLRPLPSSSMPHTHSVTQPLLRSRRLYKFTCRSNSRIIFSAGSVANGRISIAFYEKLTHI